MVVKFLWKVGCEGSSEITPNNALHRTLLPVSKGTPSIWHLAEILVSIDSSLMAIAKTNLNQTIANSWQKIAPNCQENIKVLGS